MPPRTAALLPCAFFGLAAAVNLVEGTPETLLWLCNASNLLLAAGLALAWPRGVAVATLWLVVTAPVWAAEAALASSFRAHSVLTHLGSALVGLSALRRVPLPRGLWWQALLFVIALQVVTRLVTDPAANVNAAFAPYGPFTRIFPSYASYWLANAAAFGAALAAVERLLRWLLSRRAPRQGVA